MLTLNIKLTEETLTLLIELIEIKVKSIKYI